MMSPPKTPASNPTPGNVGSNRVATNQGAIPLPWFSARRALALNWGQSRVYNPTSAPVTQKVGKSNRTTGYNYFGDLFGLIACCRVDYIESLEVGGTLVWSGFIERDSANPVYAPINLPDGSQWRFYWGNPDQPLDDLVLAGCGEAHPNYLDQAYLVGKKVPFGSNSTTPPSVRVVVERAPRFAGLDEARTREGASLVTALAELVADDWFGLGLPGLIDVASWAAQCTATKRETTVSIPGDAAHAASMGYGSPYLDKAQPAQAIFAQILQYFDGWLRPLGETLELGRFPHDGITPAGLAELNYHDFVSHPAFSSPGEADGADPVTEVSCAFADREYNGDDNSAKGFNAAARQRLGEPNVVSIDRPFLTTSYQAAEQAHEYAKFYARPESSAKVTLRRERLGGLREGDRFILNDAPSGYRQVVRITERTDPGRGGEATILIVEERGLAPLTFITPANPAPNLPPPALVAIAHGRMFQLPRAFADYGPAPVVVPLAERPAAHIAGFAVHYSSDGSSYDLLATVGRWALRGTLVAGISSTASTLTLAATGYDLPLLQSQSTAAQLDDTLILVCGYEILSIGAVTALGGGQYACAVTRGRRGSAPATHAGAAECYVIERANLEILQHANFPRTTTARYFKLPSYTPSEEQELADALALTFTFDDAAVVAPTSFAAVATVQGIVLKWVNPVDPTIVMTEIFERTAASPAPGATDVPDFEINGDSYTRGALAAGLTRFYWVRNRDTVSDHSSLVGPVTATATTGPAGPAGTDGTNGTNGINGLDGSKTFYTTTAAPPVGMASGDTWFVTDLDATTGLPMFLTRRYDGSAWVDVSLAVFEIISGTVYIRKLAVRQVDAGAIITGTLTAAIAIGSLGSLSASSGASKFLADVNGATFGDTTAGNIMVRSNGTGGIEIQFKQAGTIKAVFGVTSTGTPYLTDGSNVGQIVGFDVVSGAKLRAQSSANPGTSDAPISTPGGGYIGADLKVGGEVTAASFNATSSRRFKKNIRPMRQALKTVNALQGVRFDWRKKKGKKNDFGFIAEDVARLLPGAVGRDPSGRVDSVDYAKLTAVLVEAVKELSAEVHALKLQSRRD